MAAAAVLKNQKIIMSQQPLDRLPRNMAFWSCWPFRP